MNSESPRILILRLSSIGDVLLTTPFIQQVRKKFSNAHITYIVKKEFAELLQYNRHINKLIHFDSSQGIAGLQDLAKNLKKKNFDIVFDLHNNLRTNRLTAVFERKKVSKVKKHKIKRALLVNFKINLFNEIKTAPEKYLRVGQKYGLADKGEKLQLFLNEQTEQKVKDHFQKNDLQAGQYLSFAPGAAHYTKMWPLEYVEELILKVQDEFDTKIVLLGGFNEKNIFPQFDSNKNIVNMCGKLSLLESAGILKYAKGIVTNDSGLMHMAAALNIPIIAIFGSTVKELGFFPYNANASVLEISNLWCRPCTHIGRRKCPLGHFNCMRQISPDHVFSEMEKKFR